MITLLKPIGHCFGVLKAIEIAKETKEKYKDKNIYVFGLLVHNEEVVKALEEDGIKTICSSIFACLINADGAHNDLTTPL